MNWQCQFFRPVDYKRQINEIQYSHVMDASIVKLSKILSEKQFFYLFEELEVFLKFKMSEETCLFIFILFLI